MKSKLILLSGNSFIIDIVFTNPIGIYSDDFSFVSNISVFWYFLIRPEVQGFLLGLIFGISGVIHVSWPFGEENSSEFISGVNWIHNFLDPDERWTLEPITGMDGTRAFELFQGWSKVALQNRKNRNRKKKSSE